MVPLFIAGAIAAVAGIGGHLSAKEINEKAQIVAKNAQDIYNNAKSSLESAQLCTEKSLLTLGYSKQNVLNGSVKQFLRAYERIKDINLSDSIGLNEISNFVIDKQEVLQLREMSDVYQSSIKSGATGAAAGTIIALAASGSLPVVTGVLSTAGTALAIGEVGMAASLAGSALSLGAAMTPLAAIAAPVVLFTGISASMKADENLEKANTMYYEAQLAVEKMETSKTLCHAISDRAVMFNDLLANLNEMFSYCTGMLDALTLKKTGIFKRKTIDATKLTKDELKLIAVTRSLAGAVKAVIDTPILGTDGDLTNESEEVCENINERTSAFKGQITEIKRIDYSVKPKPLPKALSYNPNQSVQRATSHNALDIVRGLLGLSIGIGGAIFVYLYTISRAFELLTVITLTACAYTLPVLIIINNNTKFKIFKLIKSIGCLLLSAEFCVVLYYMCAEWKQLGLFWWIDIPVLIISLILLSVLFGSGTKSSVKQFALKFISCTLFLTIAPIVFSILNNWLNITFNISIIVTEVLFGIFALFCAFE